VSGCYVLARPPAARIVIHEGGDVSSGMDLGTVIRLQRLWLSLVACMFICMHGRV